MKKKNLWLSICVVECVYLILREKCPLKSYVESLFLISVFAYVFSFAYIFLTFICFPHVSVETVNWVTSLFLRWHILRHRTFSWVTNKSNKYFNTYGVRTAPHTHNKLHNTLYIYSDTYTSSMFRPFFWVGGLNIPVVYKQ